MLADLSGELQRRDYGILLMVADSPKLDTLIPKLLAYQVDGVILPAATLSSQMAVVLQRSGRPVVLVNRYLRDEVVSSVSGDNYGGGRAVAELLVQTGHRRIAFIAGQDDTSSSRDRGRGLAEGLGPARHPRPGPRGRALQPPRGRQCGAPVAGARSARPMRSSAPTT